MSNKKESSDAVKQEGKEDADGFDDAQDYQDYGDDDEMYNEDDEMRNTQGMDGEQQLRTTYNQDDEEYYEEYRSNSDHQMQGDMDYHDQNDDEDEEDEDAPLIKPTSYDIAGYGDESSNDNDEEEEKKDGEGEKAENGEEKKEGDDQEDAEDGSDKEDSAPVHLMQKDEFANETFRGPMLKESEKTTTADNDSSSLQNSNQISGAESKTDSRLSTEKIDDLKDQNGNTEDILRTNKRGSNVQDKNYESPDRHINPTGIQEQGTDNQQLLSTASFKIEPHSSVRK